MKDCFVIMPIGSGEIYNIYRNRFDEIIKPAVEGIKSNGNQAFKCIRADFVSKTGSITRDVIARLYRADAVIADLTDLNPNVFYELGVRHSLRSGTLLVGIEGTKPPFDIGDLRIIYYEDRVGAQKVAIPKIQEFLKPLLDDNKSIDSPVLLAIPSLLENKASLELEAKVDSLEQETKILKAQLEISEKSNLANQSSLESLRKAIESLIAHLSETEKQKAEETIKSASKTNQTEWPTPMMKQLSDIPVDMNSIFVLMPFSKDLEPVYQVIQSAAQMEGLHCFRADELFSAGTIMDQIFDSIRKAGLIVADLSGRNQNVMYELGVANAMGKNTLLLAQALEEVPFDLRHIRVIEYNLSFGSVDVLRNKLQIAFKQYKDS